jgi:hypothetical protein
MKTLLVVALFMVTTALVATPVSVRMAPSGPELAVDSASAYTYRRARVTTRRVVRRGYRRAAYVGAATYGVASPYRRRCTCY